MSTDTGDTPPDGTNIAAKWTSFVPRKIKILIPISMLAIAFVSAGGGAAIGYGIMRGETANELLNHAARLDKIESRRDADIEKIDGVRQQISELRGEVRQIAKYLGVEAPLPSWRTMLTPGIQTKEKSP